MKIFLRALYTKHFKTKILTEAVSWIPWEWGRCGERDSYKYFGSITWCVWGRTVENILETVKDHRQPCKEPGVDRGKVLRLSKGSAGQPAALEPRLRKSTFTQGGRAEGHRGTAGGIRHFGRAQQGFRRSKNTEGFTTQTSHTRRGKGRAATEVTGAGVHRSTQYHMPWISRNSPFQIFYCTVHTIKYPCMRNCLGTYYWLDQASKHENIHLLYWQKMVCHRKWCPKFWIQWTR